MDLSAPSEWESIFQFVADPLDMDFSKEKAAETTTLQPGRGLQVPTPPVRLYPFFTSPYPYTSKSNPMMARPFLAVLPKAPHSFQSQPLFIPEPRQMHFLQTPFSLHLMAFSFTFTPQPSSRHRVTTLTTYYLQTGAQSKAGTPFSASPSIRPSSTLSCT